MVPANRRDGYVAQVRQEGCRVGAQCAVLVAPEVPPKGGTGNLIQRFDADPYSGKTIRVSAWLRAESNRPSASVYLWLGAGDHPEIFGTEEVPVRAGDWQLRTFRAKIRGDARILTLGVAAHDAAAAWIDAVSIDLEPEGVAGPEPVSLQFEESAHGKAPMGWMALPADPAAGYSIETTKSGCHTGPVCVVAVTSALHRNGYFNLVRTIHSLSRPDCEFRLRAWVKLDSDSPNSTAQMWMRMDRANGKNGFVGIAQSPKAGDGWVLRELTGKVDGDAGSFTFGFRSLGGDDVGGRRIA